MTSVPIQAPETNTYTVKDKKKKKHLPVKWY